MYESIFSIKASLNFSLLSKSFIHTDSAAMPFSFALVRAYASFLLLITTSIEAFVMSPLLTASIIYQKAVEVLPGDTPEILQKRVMEQAEWEILPEAINLIAKNKIEVKDGRVIRRK